MRAVLPVLFRLLLLAALWLPLAGAAAMSTPRITIVTSAPDGVYAEAADALRNQVNATMPITEVQFRAWADASSAALADSRLVITIGTQAARVVASLGIPQPVLHILLPVNVYEQLPAVRERGKRSAIYLDQPPTRQLALIRLALPDWKRVAVLNSPGGDDTAQRIAELARAQGLEVREATIAGERDLYPALRTVLGDPAVLIATPDARIFNSYTIQNVLLTAYRHRSPVAGFSASYVRAGALFSLYSTPEQIALQAAEVVVRTLSGEALPPAQPPRQFEVRINANVARSLGMMLPPEESLRRELVRLEGGTP